MTEISVEGGESDLAEVIRTATDITGDDLFLVLRNRAGTVLWSGEIWQWRYDVPFDRIVARTRPVAESIAKATEAYRVKLEFEARQQGIL